MTSCRRLLSRARKDAMQSTFDSELEALRRVTTRISRAANVRAWACAKSLRGSRIARLVRLLPLTVIGVDVRRVRSETGWLLEDRAAGSAIIQIVTRTRGRTLADLAAPIPVIIMREDLVDAARLHSLVPDRTATLAPTVESPC